MSSSTVAKRKDRTAIVLVGTYVLYQVYSLFSGGNLLIGLLLLSAPAAALFHLLFTNKETSAKRALLPYSFGVPMFMSSLALILTVINLRQLLEIPYAVISVVLSGITVLATAICFFGSFSFPKRARVLGVGSLLYVLTTLGHLVLAFAEAGGWEQVVNGDLSALIGTFCSLLFYLGIGLYSINKKERAK